MKKFISMVLAVVMVSSCICIGAFATDPATTITVTGQDTTTVPALSADTTFSNITYTGKNPTTIGLDKLCISATDAAKVSGINVTFENCTFNNVGLYVIEANNFATVTVRNCTFNNSDRSAQIYAKNVIFENNTVTGSERGVCIAGSPNSVVSATVTGNTFTGFSRYGVQLGGNCTGLTSLNISGNTFENATGPAIKFDSSFTAPSDITVLKSGIGDNLYNDVTPILSEATVPSVSDFKNIYNYSTSTSTPVSSDVKANVKPTFSVTIPSSVDFGYITRNPKTTYKHSFKIIVDGTIEEDAAVKVTNILPTDGMKMYNKNGTGRTYIPFHLYNTNNNDPLFTFSQDSLKNGSASVNTEVYCSGANVQAAGSYKGIMTFAISYGIAS